jgi:hypothetical protein
VIGKTATRIVIPDSHLPEYISLPLTKDVENTTAKTMIVKFAFASRARKCFILQNLSLRTLTNVMWQVIFCYVEGTKLRNTDSNAADLEIDRKAQ